MAGVSHLHALWDYGYIVPRCPGDVKLDIVTPTRNRPRELDKQAALLADQISLNDRWVIVRDCDDDRNESHPGDFISDSLLLEINLDYMRNRVVDGQYGASRGVLAGSARFVIIELDDHDYLFSGALDAVRQAICGGAGFVYGDCLHTDGDGQPIGVYTKPEYEAWLLKNAMCPCEGVRCFPAIAYRSVGGYRWYGDENEVGGNEFPGGDYGLFMRIEQFYGGSGFVHVPQILCSTVKAAGTITGDHGAQQEAMAVKLRAAAAKGRLMQ